MCVVIICNPINNIKYIMCCTYTDYKPTKYIPCIDYESNKRGILKMQYRILVASCIFCFVFTFLRFANAQTFLNDFDLLF